MDLVGRPPVPPKKMFGLWVSEFGYDDWAELEDKLRTLARQRAFPSTASCSTCSGSAASFACPSHMGALTFDESKFPDPRGEIARLRDEQGVGLMLIEEPYVDRSRPDLRGSRRSAATCRAPATAAARSICAAWWGQGSMLDFTSAAAGDYWHDLKRQPLVDIGVLGHWTDLGEPEDVLARRALRRLPGARPARRARRPQPLQPRLGGEHRARLRAQRSAGAAVHAVALRHRRACSASAPRCGRATSAANMASLATQLNVQMHMSFSGIDYFGSDIGGFCSARASTATRTSSTRSGSPTARSLDVPLRAAHREPVQLPRDRARPHRRSSRATSRTCACATAGALPLLARAPRLPLRRAGRAAAGRVLPGRSERAHDRRREAARPRSAGRHGERLRRRPRATSTCRPGRGSTSTPRRGSTAPASWLRGVPLRPDGLFRLPLYARAGAIIPQMASTSRP